MPRRRTYERGDAATVPSQAPSAMRTTRRGELRRRGSQEGWTDLIAARHADEPQETFAHPHILVVVYASDADDVDEVMSKANKQIADEIRIRMVTPGCTQIECCQAVLVNMRRGDGVGVGGSDLWAVAHSPNGGATYTPKTDNGEW
ncbi:hypothetical protein NFJ02_07g129780 [Pycnococcus provasolii]